MKKELPKPNRRELLDTIWMLHDALSDLTIELTKGYNIAPRPARLRDQVDDCLILEGYTRAILERAKYRR